MESMTKEEQQELELIEFSQLFSFSNGLLVLPPSQVNNHTQLLKRGAVVEDEGTTKYALAVPAPTSLYPTPFPRQLFESVKEVQPIFNLLMDRVAQDTDFLLFTLEPTSQVDEFLAKLLSIYRDSLKEPNSQPIRLGILRSDYLLHEEEGEGGELEAPEGKDIAAVRKYLDSRELKLYQVELNTIAASFGSLGAITSKLHRFLAARTNNYFGRYSTEPNTIDRLPENSSLSEIARGLAEAHKLYNSTDAVILCVVQPEERNVFDQRHIELDLFQTHGVRILRKTLLEISSQAQLKEDKKLYFGDQEISVVYFRSGYAPTDFPTEKEWEARALLERSWSIKCPNIAYHLAGSKKIQQVLAHPGVLERFLDSDQANLARQFFTGLYPLDTTSHGQEAFQQALTHPTRYVLKPSREGGGNNLYGEDIVPFLQTLPPASRDAYILMDRIRPPRFLDNNLGLRFGQPALRGHFVSELGIYGIILAGTSTNQPHLNVTGGHLLRTKLESSDEGGVVVGHSVIDSPYLI